MTPISTPSVVARRARETRKTLVAAVSLVSLAASSGLLHGWPEALAAGILTVAGTFGVYQSKNQGTK